MTRTGYPCTIWNNRSFRVRTKQLGTFWKSQGEKSAPKRINQAISSRVVGDVAQYFRIADVVSNRDKL